MLQICENLDQAYKARLEEGKLKGSQWSLEKWILKLQEEAGEVAACLTKELGNQELLSELADVSSVVDLICIHQGFDLEGEKRRVFNRKSIKCGSNTRVSDYNSNKELREAVELVAAWAMSILENRVAEESNKLYAIAVSNKYARETLLRIKPKEDNI